MRWFTLIAFLAALAGCTQQPSPAPSAPRGFTVFFETDKADLTPTGRSIVNEVAAAVHSHRPSKVVVEGQASGGSPHDAELAGQRADSVVSALIAAGVDDAIIDHHAVLVGPATTDPIARVAAQKVLIELVP